MNNLFFLLQLAGGTFPTGAFSQSWGLETYIYNEKIKTEDELRDFLKMYLNTVLGGLEGVIFCSAYEMTKSNNIDALDELEKTYLAMRLTKETREVVLKTGKAFLRIVAEMSENPQTLSFYDKCKSKGISFPVAFAYICALEGIDKKDALMSFMFSTINGLVQSGLKLIPLGNVQAQKLLLELYNEIEIASKKALETDLEDAYSFCPGLDIASMNHENLPTRLYMT